MIGCSWYQSTGASFRRDRKKAQHDVRFRSGIKVRLAHRDVRRLLRACDEWYALPLLCNELPSIFFHRMYRCILRNDIKRSRMR